MPSILIKNFPNTIIILREYLNCKYFKISHNYISCSPQALMRLIVSF